MKKIFVSLLIVLVSVTSVFASAENDGPASTEEMIKKANLQYSSNDFLTEKVGGKNVSYKVENLKVPDGNPWIAPKAKDKKGSYGIITLTMNAVEEFYPALAIYNGYIKGDNYEKYSRADLITVSVRETGYSLNFHLADTPKKQIISIDQLCPSKTTMSKYTIDIEVYVPHEGTEKNYIAIDAITLENCNPEIYEDLCTVTGYYGDYLSEETKNGVVRYWPDNLYVKDGNPWVADSKKYPNGIGSKITLYTMNLKDYYTFGFYNGYQKSDLYEKNARVKKMKVTIGNKSKIVELKDTKDKQLIMINDLVSANPEKNQTVTFEILEVYPGSKYQDVCIDALYPYTK